MKKKIIKNLFLFLLWIITIIFTSAWVYENPESIEILKNYFKKNKVVKANSFHLKIDKVISMIDSDIISAFELNLACPHVKGVGLEMGSDPKIVHQIVLDAKKSTSKPVFAKLSPNIIDLVNVAKSAEDAGADAITATNTIRAMAINIDTRSPILSNNIGGMSGRSLKPISIRCVYELYQQVKIPIIGCGGVENWKDVLEYLMAGASAVQIGTAISYQGVEIFRNISNGLNKYLSNEGIKDVNNIIGIAHRA